jgi:hypothetical protein
MGQVKSQTARSHQKTAITTISFENGLIDEDQPMEDWLLRSRDKPFQIGVAGIANVRIGWRGSGQFMAARTSWSLGEFTKAVKKHLAFKGKVERLGVLPTEKS